MKKLLVQLAIITSIVTTIAFASEIKVTERNVDVSGGATYVTLVGAIEEGYGTEQLNIYVSGDANIYMYQVATLPDGSFDYSFVVPTTASNLTALLRDESGSNAKSVPLYGAFSADTLTPEDEEDIVEPEDPEEPGQTPPDIVINNTAENTQGIINIKGAVEGGVKGDDVTVLVYKTVAEGRVSGSDIGYIGQGSLDADGEYSFTFPLESNKEVSSKDYTVLVYASGRNVTDSITMASLTKYENITATLTITEPEVNVAKVVAEIDNTKGTEDVDYVIILAGFDYNDTLVDVQFSSGKFIGASEAIDDEITLTLDSTVVTVKAMLWESVTTMIPLTDPVTMER